VKVGDKNYDVKVTSSQTEQVYPEATFSWWNPRLFLGVGAGLNVTKTAAAQPIGEGGPDVSLGIMSYGRYKTTPDFSILQLGIGYEAVQKKPAVAITPFAYNIGKHLPFMENTYIGPTVTVDFVGNISTLAAIRVGL
jgi:hypothetical protein